MAVIIATDEAASFNIGSFDVLTFNNKLVETLAQLSLFLSERKTANNQLLVDEFSGVSYFYTELSTGGAAYSATNPTGALNQVSIFDPTVTPFFNASYYLSLSASTGVLSGALIPDESTSFGDPANEANGYGFKGTFNINASGVLQNGIITEVGLVYGNHIIKLSGGGMQVSASGIVTGGTVNSITVSTLKRDTSAFGDYYLYDAIGTPIADKVIYSATGLTLSAIDVVNASPSEVLGLINYNGNDSFTGTSFGEPISGLGGNDTINAGAGNDTLDGGAGIDVLNGGTGNDLYFVDIAKVGTGATATIKLQDTVTETATVADTEDAIVLTNNSGGTGNTPLSAAEFTTTSTITLATNVEGLNANALTDFKLNITGNAGNNYIIGNNTANILDGGAGFDTLDGGAGDDTYFVDLKAGLATTITNISSTELQDTVQEFGADAGDTVKLRGSATFTAPAAINMAGVFNNVEHLDVSLTGATKLNLVGTNANNNLIGNAAINTLDGGEGNDTLDGGAGADSLVGGNGDDTYIVDVAGDTIDESISLGIDTVISKLAAGSTYTISAEIENLTAFAGTVGMNLTGNASNNTITGNAGANIINGNGGFDVLTGGDGADTYITEGDDTITETNALATGGVDLVRSSGTYTLAANLENLTLTGLSAINGTGNNLINTIIGNDGNNELDGLQGKDILRGGKGDDTYIVDLTKVGTGATATLAMQDTITENLNEGNLDEIILVNRYGSASDWTLASSEFGATTTFTLAANIEGLYATEDFKINLTGNNLNNILSGNDANNVLLGLTGDDTIIGGDGNDTLDGGVGVDSLQGGAGDDTYIVDLTAPVATTATTFSIANLQDTVTEAAGEGIDTLKIRGTFSNTTAIELTAGAYYANVEGLDVSLTGAAKINLNGDSQENNLVGNAAINVISGDAGNDTLDGGAGADSLIGGIGNDTYVLDNIGDIVEETGEDTNDTIRASFAIDLNAAKYANIENVVLTGAAALNITGDEFTNRLIGNDGANIIDGDNDTLTGGRDIMNGGKGADTYIVDDATDIVIEDLDIAQGGGIDLIKSEVTFTLDTNLDNLTLTGTNSINGYGNVLANTITGNDARNELYGDAGKDTLKGGKGNDDYFVDLTKIGTGATATLALQDTVIENLGEGDDTVLLQNNFGGTNNGALTAAEFSTITTFVLGANLENLYTAFATDLRFNLTGNGLQNQLTGNNTANILDGGLNDGKVDTLLGGAGDDTYIVDLTSAYTEITYTSQEGSLLSNNLQDAIVENLGEGKDTLKLRGTFSNTSTLTLQAGNYYANVEGLDVSLTGAAKINLTGNPDDNNLVGNAAANTITSAEGNDTLDGGAGADSLEGGTGDDIYVIDNIGDIVNEAGADANDTIRSTITITLNSLYANIEHVTLTGAAAINVTGSGNNNILKGNDSANIIDGSNGEDTMDGGKGADTYFVNSEFDEVSELFTQAQGGGIDLVKSTAITFELESNIENLTLLDTGNINGFGNELANTIIGNSGHNVIDGGEGADKMTGGDGSDAYFVDNVGDVVTEINGLAAGGIDTVYSEISYILGANLENLTLIDDDDINGTGNGLTNIITGNVGNNILDGGASTIIIDTLVGNSGSDTYVVDITTTGVGNATQFFIQDIVNEVSGFGDVDTLKLRGNIAFTTAQTLTVAQFNSINNVTGSIEGLDVSLTGVSKINLLGNSDNNNLVGNAFTNLITGDAGNDTLNGGAGTDTLIGGAGNDTYVIDTLLDVINEETNVDADDTVQSANLSLDLNNVKFNGIIENAGLLGTTALNLTGNTNDNELTGNAGANIIDGKGGADDMDGGKGNDTYIVDNIGDMVEEEFTQLEGGGIDLVKSSVSYELINGNIENLTLTDGTATGGLANIFGYGNGLANIIIGNADDNELLGLAGNDTLTGNAGNDTLTGGDGNDILNGGIGQDTYVFDFALNALTNKDTIQGFSHADDTIQLNQAVFGSLTAGILNGDNYRVGTAALDADDFIINNAGNLYYDADGNGAGAAIQFATLTGTVGIVGFDDFVVLAEF